MLKQIVFELAITGSVKMAICAIAKGKSLMNDFLEPIPGIGRDGFILREIGVAESTELSEAILGNRYRCLLHGLPFIRVGQQGAGAGAGFGDQVGIS